MSLRDTQSRRLEREGGEPTGAAATVCREHVLGPYFQDDSEKFIVWIMTS